MWSGVKTLQKLEQVLLGIRNEALRSDSDLTQLTQELGNTQRERLRILSNMAKVRLDALQNESLHGSLDSADKNAEKVLEERDEEIQHIQQQLNHNEESLVELEARREKALDAVNEVSTQIAELETAVQSELAKDEGYLALLDAAKGADAVAEQAQEKAEISTESLNQKAEPYQADKLFMYLWNRGYGTDFLRGFTR